MPPRFMRRPSLCRIKWPIVRLLWLLRIRTIARSTMSGASLRVRVLNAFSIEIKNQIPCRLCFLLTLINEVSAYAVTRLLAKM
jgi:hypothetical protein